jgi:hypothetical protein
VPAAVPPDDPGLPAVLPPEDPGLPAAVLPPEDPPAAPPAGSRLQVEQVTLGLPD